MEIFNYRIDFTEINLSREEVAQLMGYAGKDVPSPIDDMITESIRIAAGCCNIQGGLVVVDDIVPDHTKKSVRISKTELLIKKRLFNELKNAEKLALFLCTAGSGISRISGDMMKEKDMLAGYILDVIGSAIVEKAMNIIQTRFGNRMAEKGLRITNRFSPGYCGWQTSEQYKLFGILPEDFCGVRLNEAALMNPVKSISGIIGIGFNVRYNEYGCELCDAKNCIYRKK